MPIIVKNNENKEVKAAAGLRIKAYVLRADVSALESWRLLDWCFTDRAVAFTMTERKLDPDGTPMDGPILPSLALGIHSRLVPWRGIDATCVRDVPLWRASLEAASALKALMPAGLLSVSPSVSGWYEDPVFYRADGTILLAIDSLKGRATIEAERNDLSALVASGVLLRFG